MRTIAKHCTPVLSLFPLSVFALVLAPLLLPSLSYGAACGGALVCACGDTVTAPYSLPADLLCIEDDAGLRVAAGVTLDLNRKAIRFQGPKTTNAGVRLEGDGAKVKNGAIIGFDRGVRMVGAGTRVADVVVRESKRYSLEMLGVNQEVVGFRSVNPGDEHIHASSAMGASVEGCVLQGTAPKEGIYLLDSEGEFTCSVPKKENIHYTKFTDPISGTTYIVQCKRHSTGAFQCDSEVRLP